MRNNTNRMILVQRKHNTNSSLDALFEMKSSFPKGVRSILESSEKNNVF